MDSNNLMLNEVEVHFQKIKYKHLGEQGIVDLKYNYVNGRFMAGGYDNSNWLIPGLKPVAKLNPNLDFDNEEPPF
jgi:hypothetical protein